MNNEVRDIIARVADLSAELQSRGQHDLSLRATAIATMLVVLEARLKARAPPSSTIVPGPNSQHIDIELLPDVPRVGLFGRIRRFLAG